MGDAGSMLIGLTVVWLLVIGTQAQTPAFNAVTALWIIAVPLMDMVAIMIRRMKKGQSAFKPDRDHLHHIFLRAGYTSRQTLAVISSIAVLFGFIGIVLEISNTPLWFGLLLFVVVFIFYTYALNHIWRILTFFRKLRGI